jgi:hypothetical protein
MKKLIIALFIASMLVPTFAHGQETTNKIDQQIDELKDKVASKVASLKLVEKRGVIGVVASSSPREIVLTDINDNEIDIDIDELTDFTSESESSFSISDIKKGMQISVLGLYNKDSRHLLARYVEDYAIPEFITGVISGKDEKESTISLSTQDKVLYKVDIEDVSKILLYSEDSFDDAEFSQVPTQANAIVVGFADPKEKNRITASRIIIFSGSPKDPRIQIIDTSSSTPTP